MAIRIPHRDREKIISHFQRRLKERYGISEDKISLQRAFKKRLKPAHIKRFNTKLVCTYHRVVKKAYTTTYAGQTVLFVYDQEIDLAKTALTLNDFNRKS